MYSTPNNSVLSLIDEYNDEIFLNFFNRRIEDESPCSAHFFRRGTPAERINMLKLPYPMNKNFFDLSFYTNE